MTAQTLHEQLVAYTEKHAEALTPELVAGILALDERLQAKLYGPYAEFLDEARLVAEEATPLLDLIRTRRDSYLVERFVDTHGVMELRGRRASKGWPNGKRAFHLGVVCIGLKPVRVDYLYDDGVTAGTAKLGRVSRTLKVVVVG